MARGRAGASGAPSPQGGGMETMYKGISNSPQTVLAESITAEAAAIPVENINVFPEAPNLATIGSGDSAEVIRYNGIEGSRLTGCERGFGGTTANFREAGTQVYRAYTVYDHDTFKANIERLSRDKLDATPHGAAHQADGSDPVTITTQQISDFPTAMTPTGHGETHGPAGSDPIRIDVSQIDGMPFEFNPSPHGSTHAKDGSDPITIEKSQISDFPAAMIPTGHAASHGATGSDALTLTKAQISDFPATMPPAAHTHPKAEITDFPTAMTPTGHKNTHKIGGSDALTPADIGAMVERPKIIEMGGLTGSGGIIDFHFDDDTMADFTSRICEFSRGIITIANDLFVVGRIFMNNGQLVQNGGFTNYGATLQPGASWNATTRQQTVNVPGSANSANLLTGPDIGMANSYEEWCNCGVRCVARSGNTLTFQCEAIPSVAIRVSILGG